jgi:hypothetical protein
MRTNSLQDLLFCDERMGVEMTLQALRSGHLQLMLYAQCDPLSCYGVVNLNLMVRAALAIRFEGESFVQTTNAMSNAVRAAFAWLRGTPLSLIFAPDPFFAKTYVACGNTDRNLHSNPDVERMAA